jgi:hypothetical protein
LASPRLRYGSTAIPLLRLPGAARALPLGQRGGRWKLPPRGPEGNRAGFVASRPGQDTSACDRLVTAAPAGTKARIAAKSCSVAPPSLAALTIRSRLFVSIARNVPRRMFTAALRFARTSPLAVESGELRAPNGAWLAQRMPGAARALPLGQRGGRSVSPPRGPEGNRAGFVASRPGQDTSAILAHAAARRE